MKLRSISTFAAMLALSATAGLVASADVSLAARPLPAGLRAIDGASGGRILDGVLTGATSSDAAFRSGIGRARRYFGRGAHLVGVVRSNDGALTLGLFKSPLGSAQVGGFVLTTFVPHGTSRVDVLFDRVDRVERTMRGLISQTIALHPPERSAPSAVASGGPPPLHAVTSPDGSVRVLLADGWHAGVFAQGQFAATGPDGAEVDQEISIPCNDPNGPMGRGAPNVLVPYTHDVIAAYQNVRAAMTMRGAPAAQTTFKTVKTLPPPFPGSALDSVEGTNVVSGVTHRFMGQVLVSPINQYGGWSLTVKMVSAPVDRYDRDLPTLVAIYNSYNVDQQVRNGQVAQTIHDNQVASQRNTEMMASVRARNTAVFSASMSHARSVQSSIDRSTSGFVHYLNDTTVLEGPNGARGTADSSFAQSIVNSDPQNFREVPVSEYGAGD